MPPVCAHQYVNLEALKHKCIIPYHTELEREVMPAQYQIWGRCACTDTVTSPLLLPPTFNASETKVLPPRLPMQKAKSEKTGPE